MSSSRECKGLMLSLGARCSLVTPAQINLSWRNNSMQHVTAYARQSVESPINSIRRAPLVSAKLVEPSSSSTDLECTSAAAVREPSRESLPDLSLLRHTGAFFHRRPDLGVRVLLHRQLAGSILFL